MNERGEGKNLEQDPKIENTETMPASVGPEAERPPLDARVDAALNGQANELGRREKGHDKKTLSGFRKFIGTAMLLGSSFLAIGCEAEKPNSGFTDNQHQNVQQRLEIKRQEIKHMKEAEGSGHKQTFSEYRQQYKKHHPSPFKTKHATPQEAQQVREANGDNTQAPQNEDMQSEKNTSPEAEQFLNNN